MHQDDHDTLQEFLRYVGDKSNMMLRRTDASPCPEGYQAHLQRPRDSIIGLSGDDTDDIDFTTEFRASIRAIKPRRRQTAIGAKKRGVEVDFIIHEDREACSSNGISLKGSILAKPPQRPNQRVSFLPEIKEQAPSQRWRLPEVQRSEVKPAPTLEMSMMGTIESEAASGRMTREEVIKRPARRGTVYIPPDDTTMPSMHMGIFSPIKDLQTGVRAGEHDATVELTGLAAQMARKRGRRDSLVAAPAKRVPLQQPTQVKQESASPRALAGKRTGKENVPPGQPGILFEGENDETKLFDLSKPGSNPRRTSAAHSANFLQSTASSDGHKKVRDKVPGVKVNAGYSNYRKAPTPQEVAETRIKEIKRYQNRPSSQAVSQGASASRRTSQQVFAPARQEFFRVRNGNVPAKLSVPKIPQIELLQQYPLLTDNISNPSLYEDSWLTHQEIAITQLVNTLFQTSQGSRVRPQIQQLRREFLALYQASAFTLLHKRLQASLQYGALRVPKDVLAQGSRLWTDLGRRERFCSFWLDTYDLVYLTAALEVAIGRECSSRPQNLQDGQSSSLEPNGRICTGARADVVRKTVNISRRSVRTFLESFLIRNEDGTPDDGVTSHGSWNYQRTLLRSLMLIKLLDGSKVTSNSSSPLCLFLPTSPYKSSTMVVKALAQMLNPGIGDVLRLLNHLDYVVDHKQYPLEEFNYHIDNLAVDLRDGVMLTRLVELLLYPTASHLLAKANEADATTTVLMPGGETLSLSEGEHDWPLSQHLKFPCLGRATKLYNVQLALSALTTVRGVDSLVRDIRAENIVDGFREKTVALLWGLTGKWGMGCLLDWGDIQGEIRRISKASHLEFWEDFDNFDEGFGGYRTRLKAWATAVGRSHGLQVRNLSTSFSDGKVFRAIVEEYTPYLDDNSGDGVHDVPLHERLERIGCSAQFVKLFAPVPGVALGRFFDRDFVVAALAFLCSRLLSATKRARAAVQIQRAWRQHLDRMITQRKRVAKRVAEQCVVVVQARQKVLWAKSVIVKFWRSRR